MECHGLTEKYIAHANRACAFPKSCQQQVGLEGKGAKGEPHHTAQIPQRVAERSRGRKVGMNHLKMPMDQDSPRMPGLH